MEKLLKIAFNELGTEEIAGENHNPEVLKYATETGIKGITRDEIPWCSTFVNWVAWKAGLKHSGKPNARSWLNVGTKVTSPEPGDVVVFWRESPQSWKGHVGFFLGLSPDRKRVYCIGGNQGNRVSVSAYRLSTVLSYQRLAPADKLEIPGPVLQIGSRGKAVVALQDALKLLNINVGTSDGAFGPKTEGGVKELQTRKTELEIDGVYNNKTRDLLESLFQA
ncbi:TIGR02594 family protein [Tangfeifania diversioriginum]|uniref:TIGR02594 family protein n=1 Tax=Tangfeifania diversioriginum TaxID=1168035 RepID=A0A1M6C054_9BACT|nr:TIGR02594 family protein [Tangfeifania diversioriginum]SHI54360.1 TIGR02594 family protein [Tangfeifania diversioriginum]